MKRLRYPFDENTVRSLDAGDVVEIDGILITGRDRLHKHFADGKHIDADFRNGALYHCGPVSVETPDGWKIVAAGPTTSVRENPYEPAFIEKTGVRIVIGKGGMDAATLEAMKKHGCVYIQAVGGAAAVAARCVKRVVRVAHLEEFGAAEALWHLEVERFPGVVAMDAKGHSLFEAVRKSSKSRFETMFE